MSRAYDHYIHTLLEPNDRIIVGDARRNKQYRPKNVVTDKYERISEEEDNRRQDAHIQRMQEKTANN